MKATVIEKDREAGGFFRYDDYPVNGVRGRDLVSWFIDKVDVMYNVTAFEYDGDGVWVVDREGARKIYGRAVAANGFREKTVLELGINGSRPSGVFYLYSAWNLINKNYSIGDKIIIYGFDHYSIALASKLAKVSEKVVMVYMNSSLIHSEEELIELGVEVLRGRVVKVSGRERVSSVKIDGREMEADTLILAELSTWNPLEVENVVGNAAMIIEDPAKMIEASRIMAESLLEGGRLIEIVCNAPHIPHKVSKEVGRIILGVSMGTELRVDGRRIVVEEAYPVIEVPSKDRVLIEVL